LRPDVQHNEPSIFITNVSGAEGAARREEGGINAVDAIDSAFVGSIGSAGFIWVRI
jgi:hypothetical protein